MFRLPLILFLVASASRGNVLKDLYEENFIVDREVTEEEDPVEYNIEHGNGNVGGDMMLTQEQIDWLEGDGNERSLWPWMNWPKTGSYVVIAYTKEDDAWSPKENENIQAAIDSYTENTCIRFIPRTTEQDYIHMIDGSGCWSYVGKQGGKQKLSLLAGQMHGGNVYGGCATQVGTPIHELMHAIGYYHEQSRSDRDDYIKINFDNIKPGMEGNFKKCENCDLQGLPYDIRSVMQYHQTAFAIDNSKPTIEALDGTPGHLIGQRSGFSPLDIEGINKIYCECAADADCSGSVTCNGGICGGVAECDPLCQDGHTCMSGVCVAPATTAPTTECLPLSQEVGRCGPRFRGRCNKDLADYAVYCNVKNGWCGTSAAHMNAQSGDEYDWKPTGCQGNSTVVPQPSCTPAKSVDKCGDCLTSDQCKKGSCCPRLKKCLYGKGGCKSSLHGKPAFCKPKCYDNMDPATCSCSNVDFPKYWPKPTC